MVAIKIIKNQERLQYQASIELKLLKYISTAECNNSHSIKLKNSFIFRKHLCFSFELLGSNLFDVLKMNSFRGIDVSTIKKVALQILECLKFLKLHDIIHCDLKPENILLKDKATYEIKVIDFGSGCFSKEQLYTYIQSRFYRAPEIILGLKYTTAIDMWSFGCILGELYRGYPILPGENEKEQLALMMELRGIPPAALLKKGKRTQLFFDNEFNPIIQPNSRNIIRNPNGLPLSKALSCNDQLLLDLVEKCLEWDPSKRLTPSQALAHKWLS